MVYNQSTNPPKVTREETVKKLSELDATDAEALLKLLVVDFFKGRNILLKNDPEAQFNFNSLEYERNTIINKAPNI